MMLASRLKERITILQPTITGDGVGGQTTAWTTLVSIYAEVTALVNAGGNQLVADQPSHPARYRLLIRPRSDLTAAMRIVWRSHTLLIHSLHENEMSMSILAYEETL